MRVVSVSAGLIVLMAIAAVTALQQPASQEWWRQGQPPELKDSPLRPHAAPPTARPAGDIPLAKLRLPPGFHVELWASGLADARSLTRGDRGTIFVGTRFAGNVYAVVDRGGTRVVHTIATGLHRPNGVAFKDGDLYVAEVSRIVRFARIEDRLETPPAPAVVFDQLPADEPHGWKSLSLGPDGRLYFGIGAPCNACVPPYTHASIVRLDPATRVLETVALGVRNTLGMDWHPASGELYFTENGRDWMGNEQPEDELNHVPRAGLHFGFPHCYQENVVDPRLALGHACAEFQPPIATLGPHVAALGMRFYTGGMFPAAYRNRALIALHGSWNRDSKTGFAVVQATVGAKGAKLEPFMDGFLEGARFWGRPVDVHQLPDGSVLVSDDWNGAIYRVLYRR